MGTSKTLNEMFMNEVKREQILMTTQNDCTPLTLLLLVLKYTQRDEYKNAVGFRREQPKI